MELVEPIRDLGKLAIMKEYLKKRNIRDYILFVLGISSGLRISDLLNIKVKNIINNERIKVKEKKTRKCKDFPLNDDIREDLINYVKDMNEDEFIFKSKKGQNKPISRVQAWRIINDAGRFAGIEENLGTHTLRKTFGYWAYKNGIELSTIMKLLNHSRESYTLLYIGITKEDLDNVYMNMNKFLKGED